MKRIKNLKWILALAAVSVSVSSCDKECKNAPDLGTKENHNITTLRFSDTLTMTLPNTRVMELDQVEKQTQSGVTYQMPQVKWVVGDKYSVIGCIRYKGTDSTPVNWRQNYGILTATVLSVSDDGRSGKFRLSGTINMKNRNINLTDTNNPSLVDNEDNWYFMGLVRGKMPKDNPNGIEDRYGDIMKDIQQDYTYTSDFMEQDIKGMVFTSPNKFIAVHPKDEKIPLNIPLAIAPQKVKIIKAGNNSYELKAKDPNSPFTIKPIGNVLCVKIQAKKDNNIPTGLIRNETSTIKIVSRFLVNSRIYYDFWHYPYGTEKMGTPNWLWHYEVGDIGGKTVDTSYSYLTGNNSGEGIRTEQNLTVDYSFLDKSPHVKKAERGGKILSYRLDPGESINFYIWSVYNSDYMAESEKNIDKPIIIDLKNFSTNSGTPMVSSKPVSNSLLKEGMAITMIAKITSERGDTSGLSH